MTEQIKIGPEFFAKSKNDYDNWYWALVREFLQNSIDACRSINNPKIDVTLGWENGNTVMTVVNNGEAMTRETLVNKLLCLGGSGKNFNGNVGGFGKAKELLYFCHLDYTIHSGSNLVNGCGAQYTITDVDFLPGTRSTITIPGDCLGSLVSELWTFSRYAQWNGALTLKYNDVFETLPCTLIKGSRRRDLNFGVVYTSKAEQNRLVVRIGGIPMFHQYCFLDRLVIIELTGKSNEVMTSNRNGLLYSYQQELLAFITELAVDKRSAIKPDRTYEHFSGRKFFHATSRSIVSAIQEANSEAALAVAESNSSQDVVGEDFEPRVLVPRAKIDAEFVLRNETGLEIPGYYHPNSESFSPYSMKLLKIWGRLMLQLHKTFDHESTFSIGFSFGDSAAIHEVKEEFGRIYYIAPTVFDESIGSFKKRWKFDTAGKKMLLSVAVHEFVHGLGYGLHNEDFTTRHTLVIGVVMARLKEFNWCFA